MISSNLGEAGRHRSFFHLVSPTRPRAVDALGAPSPPRAPPNGPFAGRAASGRSRLGLGSRRAAFRARATRPPRARADRLLRPRSLRDALAPCSAESGTNRSGRRQTLQYTYTRFPYPLPGATTGTKDMASAFSQRRWQSCGVASRQLLQGGSNGAESCSGRVTGGNEAACTDSLTAAPSNGLYLAGKCGDGGVPGWANSGGCAAGAQTSVPATSPATQGISIGKHVMSSGARVRLYLPKEEGR